jgi:hypothetical protein
MTTTKRESTANWTPPAGEFRPSALGACPRYAWEQINRPEEEREELHPIGREVMLAVGHAAEEKWIELVNERLGWALEHGVVLDNGYGGECHPDAVSFERRTIYEIKHTSYKKPAPYHVAQISWYLMRMAAQTGQDNWTGVVVLLDKFGKEPGIHEIPFPDAAFQKELLARAESHTAPTAPTGMCVSREQASTKARYYDLATPCGQRTEISCPYANKCFPVEEDDLAV